MDGPVNGNVQANMVTDIATDIADQLEADVLLYNGPLERPLDTVFIQECVTRQRRQNVLLLLVTAGGDAECAYRIARCLQEKYDHFSLYVSGVCKSAGTLVATGAHELIVADNGELGPLDVQMSKKDELWETQSGLIVMDTIRSLQENAFLAFEHFFMEIKSKSNDAISLKTATEIATQMTTGLFAPLFGQVDPMHIGEASRALSIASDYGQRLLEGGGNITAEDLEQLTSGYPSHGFVIDRKEAEELFTAVRGPTLQEARLAQALGNLALMPNRLPVQSVVFLNKEEVNHAGESATEEDRHGGAAEEAPDDFATGQPEGNSPAGSESDRANGTRESGQACSDRLSAPEQQS